MEPDYSYHYLQLLDKLINGYIESTKKSESGCFDLHGCSTEVALKKFLFFPFALNFHFREKYNDLKRSHTNEINIDNTFYELLLNNLSYIPGDKTLIEEEDKEYIEKITGLMQPYKHKIVYYAYNERLLKVALPVLSRIPEDVVVLSAREIPDNLECSDNLMAIEFGLAKVNYCSNLFMKTRFPGFYYLFNNIELLIRVLMPKSIVVVEGVHTEFEILASIGKKYNIPSVCIQHGWPGIIHTQFRDMQYDKFLCWGDGFSHLLKPFNPAPEFISTGYPYKIGPYLKEKKKAISFFFQGPFLISTNSVIQQMTEFAIFCSGTFRDYQILIREHPQYKLDQNMKDSFVSHSNVSFVPPSTHTLDEIMNQSLLSVAVFSSVIMESLLYGSIPFIFNLTSMPGYYPDLQEEGLGIEVKTLEQAKTAISDLLRNPMQIKKFQEKMANSLACYFSQTGEKAIQNMVSEIINP